MACKCGGCGGRAATVGGSDDAGFDDVGLAVTPDFEPSEDGGLCPGPGERLSRALETALEGEVGSAAAVFGEGDFTSVRCWPLWTWLAALLWLGWLRS